MSDIAIRFDGLLLASAIALSTLIFGIVCLSSLILAVFAETRRAHRLALAKGAAALVGFGLSCLAALLAYMEAGPAPTSPTDWIDWIALPWTMLFVFSLIGLFRRAKGEDGNA